MQVRIEIPDNNPELARYIIKHLIHGLALGCRPFFLGPNALPSLYDTDITYQEEPSHGSGIEEFRLPCFVAAMGKGDCDGLSLYQLSYYLAHEQPVNATVADYMGDGSMHAQIRWQDTNEVEDPAIARGSPYDWPEKFLYDL